MSVHPFRPLPVVPPAVVLVEEATCQWCRWAGVVEPRTCSHPCYRGGTHWCHGRNPNGQCPHFSPTWWTLLGRALRLWRAPAMVDPEIWEKRCGG